MSPGTSDARICYESDVDMKIALSEKRLQFRYDDPGGTFAFRDGVVCTMKIQHREVRKMRCNRYVSGLPGKATARDLHLHNVDAGGYDIDHRWRVVASVE